MDDKKILKTGIGPVADTAPVVLTQNEESIRKAEFEKVRKKIFSVHDGLFRRLAQ